MIHGAVSGGNVPQHNHLIHHIDSRDRRGTNASHAEAGEASPSGADGRGHQRTFDIYERASGTQRWCTAE